MHSCIRVRQLLEMSPVLFNLYLNERVLTCNTVTHLLLDYSTLLINLQLW